MLFGGKANPEDTGSYTPSTLSDKEETFITECDMSEVAVRALVKEADKLKDEVNHINWWHLVDKKSNKIVAARIPHWLQPESVYHAQRRFVKNTSYQ